jgi:exopolysaccharide biosynthesis protein
MRKTLNLKRFISIIALIFYIAGVPAYALGKAGSAEAGEVVLYDRTIAKSITYSEKQIYNQEKNIKQRMNIITADLNDSDVALIFSKAKDKEKKAEVLTQQIYREIFKGNNVVAGVNADMFNMTTGFSTGPQIKDGAIIAGQSSKSEEKIYPVF